MLETSRCLGENEITPEMVAARQMLFDALEARGDFVMDRPDDGSETTMIDGVWNLTLVAGDFLAYLARTAAD